MRSLREADDEKGRIQEWLREQMSRMLQQAGRCGSARVDALERRVAELEKKLATAVPEHEATSDLCEPEGCG
jgi:polyhydroxyalkanoate synthesis regulator phasin